MIKISGTYLKKLRTRHGYSIRKLAELLYTSKTNICRWENKDSLSDISIIDDLAQLYGLTIDDLLHEREVSISPKKQTSSVEFGLFVVFLICAIILGILFIFDLIYLCTLTFNPPSIVLTVLILLLVTLALFGLSTLIKKHIIK